MMKILRIAALILAMANLAAAQTASLDAPEQATIGSTIEVSWTVDRAG